MKFAYKVKSSNAAFFTNCAQKILLFLYFPVHWGLLCAVKYAAKLGLMRHTHAHTEAHIIDFGYGLDASIDWQPKRIWGLIYLYLSPPLQLPRPLRPCCCCPPTNYSRLMSSPGSIKLLFLLLLLPLLAPSLLLLCLCTQGYQILTTRHTRQHRAATIAALACHNWCRRVTAFGWNSLSSAWLGWGCFVLCAFGTDSFGSWKTKPDFWRPARWH